jgi:hypothetical protein
MSRISYSNVPPHAHQLKNFHYPQVTKNVILSKKKLARKGDIFMNLSIQDELQLFSEELYRHLTPSLFGRTRKRIRFCKKKTKVFWK